MERRASYMESIERASTRRRILIAISIAVMLAAVLAISCSSELVTNVKSEIGSMLPSARFHLWEADEVQMSSQSTVLKKPADPSINGFIFRGWAYDSKGERMVAEADWNRSIMGEVDIYAIWDVAPGYKVVNASKHIAYENASSAIAAASNGDTIRLACDLTLDSVQTIKAKSLTLDLNGYTISASSTLEATSLFIIDNGGSLTIKDSSEEAVGKVDASTLERAITIAPDEGYTASFTLEGGSLAASSYPVETRGDEENIQLVLTGGALLVTR